MKKIILISKCKSSASSDLGWALFSFRGFYLGHEIAQVRLEAKNQNWERGEEYVIYLKVVNIERKVLIGETIKARKLSDFMQAN